MPTTSPPSGLRFDLVVPLFNEARNITSLVADIAGSGLVECGLSQAVLVDNASSDETGRLITELATAHPWIKPVHLAQNVQYGGGVFQGLLRTNAEFVAVIPGDNQVSPADLCKVWRRLDSVVARDGTQQVFVKGRRTVREDGPGLRLASGVYTALANGILGLGVRDVNGLPKIFHRSLLDLMPTDLFRTFTFDAQLLDTARRHGWLIEEVPVRFLARRAGVSSWSRKRFQTYRETVKQLLHLRRQRAGFCARSGTNDRAQASRL